MGSLFERYKIIRSATEHICSPLEKEDYVVQPIVDVSPPKWHLGHTTWFFETFVLGVYQNDYRHFQAGYDFVFNSYYENAGARVIRTDRGNLSRPTVDDIFLYRRYVDERMEELLAEPVPEDLHKLIELGLNHEQQHQELLWYDIKYILGHNPLFPSYHQLHIEQGLIADEPGWISFAGGLHWIGFEGEGFHFDNEADRHQVFVQDFSISKALVSNGEYLEFILAGGYRDFNLWHAEGWDWVKLNQIVAPLYWHFVDGHWMRYGYSGLENLDLNQPLSHISYYEAYAFACWKGMRLPTEFEWELSSSQLNWGKLWEWTSSSYQPYPGFSKAPGALGEYNGKFMVNQQVLRGASIATAAGHSRNTYRNFFHANLRWMFSGIRLVR